MTGSITLWLTLWPRNKRSFPLCQRWRHKPAMHTWILRIISSRGKLKNLFGHLVCLKVLSETEHWPKSVVLWHLRRTIFQNLSETDFRSFHRSHSHLPVFYCQSNQNMSLIKREARFTRYLTSLSSVAISQQLAVTHENNTLCGNSASKRIIITATNKTWTVLCVRLTKQIRQKF